MVQMTGKVARACSAGLDGAVAVYIGMVDMVQGLVEVKAFRREPLEATPGASDAPLQLLSCHTVECLLYVQNVTRHHVCSTFKGFLPQHCVFSGILMVEDDE